MSRKQKQYHFIYKTINVNGKYYIGMHSTDNLDDGYLGSGQRLWHAIKKYGKENFKRETLEFLPDRSSLKTREKQIVNEELINDPLCMNISLGGTGTPYGASFPNRKSSPLSESHRQHISEANKGKKKAPLSEECKKRISESKLGKIVSIETRKQQSIGIKKSWVRRKENGLRPIKRNPHSEKTKEKIRESNKKTSKNKNGANNPNAKIYKFIDEAGVEYIVKGNRKTFCNEHGISLKKVTIMLKLYNICEYKGWKIIKVE